MLASLQFCFEENKLRSVVLQINKCSNVSKLRRNLSGETVSGYRPVYSRKQESVQLLLSQFTRTQNRTQVERMVTGFEVGFETRS